MSEIKARANISGSVWQITSAVGDRVEEDQPIVVLESMKMEIPVTAPRGGVVKAILVEAGQIVAEDEVIAVIEAD